jgi:hypothetical protein
MESSPAASSGTSTVNRSVRDHSFTARGDHRASDRDRFFVRVSDEMYQLDAPQGQAACCLPSPPEAASRFDLGPDRGQHPGDAVDRRDPGHPVHGRGSGEEVIS